MDLVHWIVQLRQSTGSPNTEIQQIAIKGYSEDIHNIFISYPGFTWIYSECPTGNWLLEGPMKDIHEISN